MENLYERRVGKMKEEDFEKRWNTCRYCGITKERLKELKEQTGKCQSNYVMDGICRTCREKKQDESDFEEAKKDGEITRDESIMCPYCGFVVDNDLGEYNEDDSLFDCPECDQKSELYIEYTTHFTTKKRVE